MIRCFCIGLLLAGRAMAVCVSGPIPMPAPFNPAVAQARELALQRSLRSAVQAFRSDVASAGLEIERSWMEYLRWNDWVRPLLERSEWNGEALSTIASLLYRTEPGFEREALLRLRTALDEAVSYLLTSKGLGAAPGLSYHARVQELLQLLQSPSCDLNRIEDRLGELAALGQAPQLVTWVRSQLGQSNVVIRVNPSQYRKALEGFGKQGSAVKNSSNWILGAWVTGTNYASTTASADVVNAPDGVRLRVSVRGTVNSPHNVARKGPATVHGSSVSQLFATSDIAWNGRSFYLLAPQASATTQSQTHRVEAPILLRRIAARQAAKKKSQAESIGAGLVAADAKQDMTAQLQPEVTKLNTQVGDLLKTIEKAGIYPEIWQTRLDADALQLGVRIPSFSGLGSKPRRFPAIDASTAMSLSMHETAPSGLFRKGLAGSSWRDVEFAQLQREITGMNSEAFLIGVSPERWSVVWDWEAPVRLQIAPEGVTFVYRFRSVSVDGKQYNVPVAVSSRFSVVATNLGLEFRRNAEVVVSPLSSADRLDSAVEALLNEKFSGLFEEVFYLDGLQFPAGGEFNAVAKYELSAVQLDSGWIHLFVKEKAEAAVEVIAK